MRERPALDLGGLPTWGLDASSTTWWGTLAYIGIEGSGFVLAAGMYLYLAVVTPRWPPPGAPLNLWPGAILALFLVVSLLPNLWLNRMALRQDMRSVRLGLVVMSVIGGFALAIRAVEITLLGVRWDASAYGSMIWLIIGLHTTHLVTDVGDSIVLAALMFTRHAQPRRFADVTDNAFYWIFVVVTWPPLFALIYWPYVGGGP
jgi:heme/copper-type cytochrome/quinol oxidase subunit 3